MTPISASSPASAASAMNPGVNGPTATPMGDEAEHERQHQASGDGGDQRAVFGHRNCIIDELFDCYRY